jgi:hypothetical protein
MRAALVLAPALWLGIPIGSHSESESAIVEACAGPTGELRLAREHACRSSERPFSWQRGGGVFVLDAEGRPLGRALDRDSFWIHVDATGLRVAIDSFTGLPQAQSIVGFTEPDCEGVAVGSIRQAAGDVVGYDLRDRLLVGSERILESATVRSEVGNGRSCRNLVAPRTTFGAVREVAVLEAGALGFELPVALPMRFGTGPLAEIDEEIVDACVAPGGRLRLSDAGSSCRSNETPVSWQRLGGLRVYDGTGRDVGAALGTFRRGAELAILLPASGAWIQPNPFTGELEQPFSRGWSEPDCRGDSFAFDFFLLSSGRVFADTTPGAFVVATNENVLDAPILSRRVQGGACSNIPGTIRGHPLVPYHGAVPELPLPVPLVVGFPGSPLANPEGPALPLGFVSACAGPDGRLRVVPEGAACRQSEQALRWPLRGGFRALDANGLELGAFFENPDPDSGLSTDTMAIIDDVSGLRFGVQIQDGALGKDFTGGLLGEVSYTGPFCNGTAFLLEDARVGWVFPFRGRLLVGTRLEPLVERSLHESELAGCSARSLFPDPIPSTHLEPFTGVVPFALPVATPLRLGSGH